MMPLDLGRDELVLVEVGAIAACGKIDHRLSTVPFALNSTSVHHQFTERQRKNGSAVDRRAG